MRRIISICCMCLISVALYAQQNHRLTFKSVPEQLVIRFCFYVNDNRTDQENVFEYDVPAGAKVEVYPMANDTREWRALDYYTFKGFSFESDPVEISLCNNYTDRWIFTMPERDVTIIENFEYTPDDIDNPNPGTNSWDAGSKTLIVDDITSSNFDRKVPEADRPLVERIIVSGSFFTNDTFHDLHIFPNLNWLDLTRTTLDKVSKKGRWSSYYYDYSNNFTNLTDILLPATVKLFEEGCFDGTPIQNLTLLALTPPQLATSNYWDGKYQDEYKEVAFNNPDMVVFVPSEAVPLYQADKWWGKYDIQPISGATANLVLNLMENATDELLAPYRNMTIELENIHTGQKRRMIATGRNTYTFRSLPINTAYTVRLTTPLGGIVGQIDNVYVGEEDATATFASLLTPHRLQLKAWADVAYDPNMNILNVSKTNVDDAVAITWLDADGKPLAHGATIAGVVPGQELKYIVKLQNVKKTFLGGANEILLKAQYVASDTVPCTVSGSEVEDYFLRLLPLHRLGIHAYDPLVSFSYSEHLFTGGATLMVDGEAVNSYSILPREPYVHGQGGGGRLLPEGTYIVSVKGDPHGSPQMKPESYALQTRTVFLSSDMEMEFAMKKPAGNVIRLTAERQAASTDGEGRIDNVPLEAANILIRDVTHKRDSLSYNLSTTSTGGNIILADTLQAGTQVEVSVSYDTGNYEPQKATATVVHPDSTITMDMRFKHKGNLFVRVNSQENHYWLYGLLFDAKGELATSYFQLNNITTLEDETSVQYHGNTINSLKSGAYKLVLVNWTSQQHNMDRFHTMADVERLLTSGKNCMITPVTIQDGVVTNTVFDEVPYVSDLKFFLDGGNSRISYNQDNIALGFMQTVKVNVAFQPAFKQRVSDVRLTFSPQGGITFVKGSMMVGREVNNDYMAFSNKELPLADFDNQIRFCVMPQNEGEAGVGVRVSFKVDGNEYDEMLPLSMFTVKSATITAPKITSEPSFMVRGTTVADADVKVVCGDEVIGQAKSNAAGEWGVLCTLSTPTNLETYDINAKIKISGTEINTNSISVKYDQDEVTPKTVTMSWFNYHPVHMMNSSFTWDYTTGKASAASYDFNNLQGVPTDINFVIDLTKNDTTVVKAVTLTVFTSDKNSRDLECSYHDKLDRWVAVDAFFTYCLPVNIHVEVTTVAPKKADHMTFRNTIHYSQAAYNEYVDNCILGENALFAFYKDANGRPLTDANSIVPVDIEAYGVPTAAGYTLDKEAIANGGLATILENLGFSQAASILRKPVPDAENPYGDDDFEKWLADCEKVFANLDKYTSQYDIPSLRERDTDYSIINGMSDNVKFSVPATTSHNALIADGFRSMLLTDGTMAYRKEISNTHVAIVYPNDNIRIDILNNASNSLRAMANEKAAKGKRYDDVIEEVVFYIDKMKEYLDELLGICGKFCDIGDNIDELCDAGMKIGDEVITSTSTMLSYGASKGWFNTTRGSATMTAGLNKMCAGARAVRTCQWIKSKVTWLMNSKVGRFAKGMGQSFSLYGLANDIVSGVAELTEVVTYYSYIPRPCSDDLDKAAELGRHIAGKGLVIGANYTRKIGFDIAGLQTEVAAATGAVPTGGISLLMGGLVKVGIFAGNWLIDQFLDDTWKDAKPEILQRLGELECVKSCKKKGTCPKPNKPDDSDDKPGGGDFGDTNPIMDPSGFVYEAVETNRVESATATVYFKEKYKDMYGDEHERDTQWDAENYGQVNPQQTDINGEYGWMVPQGLWQVKYEKEGYETTYSEWLPVPPPQLDVNVEMKQLTQPLVKSVKAYEKGVQINFNKFMQPESLNGDNIFVTRNNQKVEGTLEMVKARENKLGQSYTPSVRFIPTTPLAAGQKVLLTVKSNVKSYAGIEMEEDFQQEFDVEKCVEAILADSLVNVVYGKQRTITIGTQPSDAAVGKKMLVECYSTDIATIDKQVLTLDAQGEAQLTIHGELLGTTALRCQMEDDEDATALVIVGVRDSLGIYVLAPIASRASGSEVYYGTKILLSSNTHGATIYYTLDGSCPCDDNNPAVKVYDNAKGIIIEADNVTIKAMAVAPDMDASDIETYTYTLRRNTATYDLKEGWNWVSHNQRTEMDANKLVSGQSYVVDGSNQRVSTIQPAQSYQAYSTEAKSMTLSGIAWNPMEQAITLQSGWNWLGFPMNQVMTPAEALQFAQAEEGDIIVGQDGFSEYSDGQWTGSLLTLVPGKGYAYISQSAKAFYLNGTIVSTAYLIDTNIKTHWPVNMHTYQNIMPVTAILTDGSAQLGEDYVIGAFNDDVTCCLGEAQWINGRFLLLVNGEQDATIRYLAYHKSSGRVYDLIETSRFRATCVGSRKSPLTLTLGGENTGITELPFNKRPNVLYDLQGRRVIGQPKHGIYIGNGKKVIY